MKMKVMCSKSAIGAGSHVNYLEKGSAENDLI